MRFLFSSPPVSCFRQALQTPRRVCAAAKALRNERASNWSGSVIASTYAAWMVSPAALEAAAAKARARKKVPGDLIAAATGRGSRNEYPAQQGVIV